MWRELQETFEWADESPDVRVII
ncbi:MAG: hypothetical protein L7T24_05790, partial [Luminiphilus sp.]|nr:hypothetical protein [Luminiphilus sp.]